LFRFMLLSFAALLLATCTGCVPAEFFTKLATVAVTVGRVAEGMGAVAKRVADVSEKVTKVSATLAAKKDDSFSNVMLGLVGLAAGGAATGGGIFAMKNNGRKKNGG